MPGFNIQLYFLKAGCFTIKDSQPALLRILGGKPIFFRFKLGKVWRVKERMFPVEAVKFSCLAVAVVVLALIFVRFFHEGG